MVETWVVKPANNGEYNLPEGEIGRLNTIPDYTSDQNSKDDYMALLAGSFLLEILEKEDLEKEDAEAMVEEDVEEWEFIGLEG